MEKLELQTKIIKILQKLGVKIEESQINNTQIESQDFKKFEIDDIKKMELLITLETEFNCFFDKPQVDTINSIQSCSDILYEILQAQ